MLTTPYRHCTLQAIIFFMIGLFSCQSRTSQHKTDSIARLVIHYLNTNKPDSVYQLTDEKLREKVTPIFWASMYKEKISGLLPFTNLRFITGNDSVSQYKVYGKMTFNCYIGLDKQDKINKLRLIPDLEANKPVVMTKKALTDNKLNTQVDSAIDRIISTYIQIKGNVGISAGVFYNGKSYFYDYGERKKDNKELPNQHTLYDIGSITKTFTSTLLAIAIDEGKVTLETPIVKFLPDSVAENPDLKNITFKNLANHTSGLPREAGNLEHMITDADQLYGNYGIKDMFSFLKHFKQTRQPGAKFEYSNLAAGLLGVLLEKIYHQSYPDLIKGYITSSLQMNETMCTIDTDKFKNLAMGYDEVYQPTPFIKMIAYRSAGVIKSTTFDLLTYAKAQLFTSNATLSAALKLTHQITYNNKSNIIGLGWFYLPKNQNLLQHDGGTFGYRSFICTDLSKQIAVVILTNNVRTVDAMGGNLIEAIRAIKN